MLTDSTHSTLGNPAATDPGLAIDMDVSTCAVVPENNEMWWAAKIESDQFVSKVEVTSSLEYSGMVDAWLGEYSGMVDTRSREYSGMVDAWLGEYSGMVNTRSREYSGMVDDRCRGYAGIMYTAGKKYGIFL